MELKLKKLSPSAEIPAYQTEGAAGMDLKASIPEAITLAPGDHAMIPTGIAAAAPVGTALFLFARSGLAAKHGISLRNSVGVVDSDYRGEITVPLVNTGRESFTIHPGERIAQMVLLPVLRPVVTEVDSLDETERGTGGFGSTGLK